MRIDSSGNVGIGNSNPADYNFDTGVNLVVGSSSTNGQIQVLSGTSGTGYLAFADGVTGAENYRGLIQYHHGSNYMGLRTNGTERYRIDSKGTLFSGSASYAHNTYAHAAVFTKNSTALGTVVIEDSDVSSGIGNTVLTCYLRDSDPATLATFVRFADGGGGVGSITHNDDGGGVSYNTTSDYRLKENVNYDWDALTLVNQLKPAKFNFIKNPSQTVQGFLAHEVSDLVPSSVRGNKDHMMDIGTITDSDENVIQEDVYEHFCKTDEGQTWTRTGEEPMYQQLDYSRIVPLLTKAIQEQQTVIDDLKSRIETLEG